MSSRIALNPRRVVATCIALAFALCLLGTHASAQVNIQPVDEVFVGYSWLHPNGYGDLGYKVPDIVGGFDLSNTYYLPSLHNVGVLLDGSGHISKGDGLGVGYILGGLQFKYHTDTFSPFARVFVGTANQSPECCSGTHWSAAVGAGGGFDLTITHKFAIRLAQVDYIYSNYTQTYIGGHSSQWNSIRLAAGLVVNLGSYYNPPLTCTASATPTEVFAPDPVKVTTTGAGFNPKHTIAYSWATNGGKMPGCKRADGNRRHHRAWRRAATRRIRPSPTSTPSLRILTPALTHSGAGQFPSRRRCARRPSPSSSRSRQW